MDEILHGLHLKRLHLKPVNSKHNPSLSNEIKSLKMETNQETTKSASLSGLQDETVR